jgi:hypothetical protein
MYFAHIHYTKLTTLVSLIQPFVRRYCCYCWQEFRKERPLVATRSRPVSWKSLSFERYNWVQTYRHDDITHLTQIRSQGEGGCKWAQCTPNKSGSTHYEFAKYQRQTLIIQLTQVRHPAASTCCVCWTAMVGENLFSKMYIRAGRFV